MRRLVSVFLGVAVFVVAAVVFAAPAQHGNADLTALSASGVSGKAQLVEAANGVNVALQVKGLRPGIEYTAQFYQNSSCQPEATTNLIERFTANPSGGASINAKLTKHLPDFGSISVVLASDETVQACGPVTVK